MMEFGSTLRLAREAKGFTQAQIAEMTHMAPATVADLENENFGRIAAPIYGRGFVKLYCEAVGIDPKPMIDEFMSIYNGERDTGIRERKPVAAEKRHDEPQTPPPPPPPPPPQQQPMPVPDQAIEQSIPAVDPEPPSPPPVQDAVPPKEPTQVVSRYAAPMRMECERTFSIPPSFWRICALVAVAVVVFWGILTGMRALYRATTSETPPTGGEETPVVQEAVRPTEKPAAKPEVTKLPAVDIKREPQKIPAFYID